MGVKPGCLSPFHIFGSQDQVKQGCLGSPQQGFAGEWVELKGSREISRVPGGVGGGGGPWQAQAGALG